MFVLRDQGMALPQSVSFPILSFGLGSRAWEATHWLIKFHVSTHIIFTQVTLANLTFKRLSGEMQSYPDPRRTQIFGDSPN